MTTPARRSSRRRTWTPAELIALFGAVPLFARLPESQREEIGRAAQPCLVRRGETVVRQGEPGDAVYVVASGSLVAQRLGRNGERRALVVIEAPGSFGELALLDGRPRSATIEALEDSELLAVGRSDFLGVLARDPRLVDGLLRELGQMVRRLSDQLADESLLDLPARVAKTLLRLAERDAVAGDPQPAIALSQAKLAELAGGSRQSVNRALSGLATRGLIRIDGRRVVILDVAGLRVRAGIAYE